MSRTMPSTFRTSAGSMKVSRRISDVRLLQLLVDLRRLDLLRADVVDDLDALPLLHVVDDELADDAVRERVVARSRSTGCRGSWCPRAAGSRRRIDLFGLFVVGHPDVCDGWLGFELDVIEVGLGSMSDALPWASKHGPIQVDDRAENRRAAGPPAAARAGRRTWGSATAAAGAGDGGGAPATLRPNRGGSDECQAARVATRLNIEKLPTQANA